MSNIQYKDLFFTFHQRSLQVTEAGMGAPQSSETPKLPFCLFPHALCVASIFKITSGSNMAIGALALSPKFQRENKVKEEKGTWSLAESVLIGVFFRSLIQQLPFVFH